MVMVGPVVSQFFPSSTPPDNERVSELKAAATGGIESDGATPVEYELC